MDEPPRKKARPLLESVGSCFQQNRLEREKRVSGLILSFLRKGSILKCHHPYRNIRFYLCSLLIIFDKKKQQQQIYVNSKGLDIG